MSNFLNAVNSHDSKTFNSSISHSTTGSHLLDYFSKYGTYRDREQSDVNSDINKAFAEDPFNTLKAVFYLRAITRKSDIRETSSNVKGQGNKDEFRKAIVALYGINQRIVLNNLWLIPQIGCWSDLFHETILSIIPHHAIVNVVMRDGKTSQEISLLKKYLPQIKAKSKCLTARAKLRNKFAATLMRRMKLNQKTYRAMKSSGNHHKFQTLMCQNKWKELDFSMIPGKALNSLASNKGKRDSLTTLQRHSIEQQFVNWMDKKDTIPFNGYPYDLYKRYLTSGDNIVTRNMLNKQFDTLIKTAKKGGGITGNVWCALDTSGSMTSNSSNPDIAPIEVCIGLGIYFSTLNQGSFHKNVIMFDSTSRKHQLNGKFCDMASQIPQNAMGSTNFDSVIDEIVRVRKNNPEIPIEDYPTTILVVSDMQFNPSDSKKTNYEYASERLGSVGLPIPRFIWWDVTGYRGSHLNKKEDKGVVMLSGFDGAVVSQILGGNKDKETKEFNAHQNMLECLNQEFLNHLALVM